MTVEAALARVAANVIDGSGMYVQGYLHGRAEGCSGHAVLPDESYDRLRDRYDENPVGFVAELAKHNAERKIMHAILTRAGVPSETAQGRALCLVARLAILAEKC